MKKISICVFLLLVTLTSICSEVAQNNEYHYTYDQNLLDQMDNAIQGFNIGKIIELIYQGVDPNFKGGFLHDQPVIGELISYAAVLEQKILLDNQHIKDTIEFLKTTPTSVILEQKDMSKYKKAIDCQALIYPFIADFFHNIQIRKQEQILLLRNKKRLSKLQAKYNKLIKAIDFSLEHGADLNQLLFSSWGSENSAHLPYLVKKYNHKINLDKQNEGGDSPLHLAVLHDNAYFKPNKKCRTQILLELGAYHSAINKDKKIPADLAEIPFLQNLLSDENVKRIQMPHYKQKLHATNKQQNLHTLVSNRGYGIK